MQIKPFFLIFLALWAPLAYGADEPLGPDGFPASWTPADFAIGSPTTPVPSDKLVRPQLEGATAGVAPYAIPLPVGANSPTHAGKKMVSMRVSDMKTITLPAAYGASRSTVVAIPPAAPVATSRTVSTSPSTALSATIPAPAPKPLAGAQADLPPLWDATEPDWPATLVSAFAKGISSPALRDSIRTLLTTEAPPPAGHTAEAWLATRGQLLEKLGMFEAAWGLWSTLGTPSATTPLPPETLYGWAQARLLAGDASTPCPLARTLTTTTAPTPNTPWPTLVTVCQLLQPAAEGNVAATGLSLQLIEPVLRQSNPALLKVLYAVQDGKPVGAQSGGALGGAVLAAYPALIGSGTLAKMPDIALRRLISTPQLPSSLRQPAALALAAQTNWGEDGQTAWGFVSASVPMNLPDAVILAGSQALSPSLVVPAALRAGNLTLAKTLLPRWPVPPSATPTDQQSKLNITSAHSRLLIAAQAGALTPQGWATWQASLPLTNTPIATTALRMVLGLDAMGLPVPEPTWAAFRNKALTGNTGADPLWQRLMQQAAQAKNTPKVMALLTEALNGRPVAEAPAGTLATTLQTLRSMNQTQLAWRLLAEATLPTTAPKPTATPLPLPVAQPMPAKPEPLDTTQPVSATTPSRSLTEPSGMLPPPRVTKPTVARPKPPTKP